MGRKRVGTRKYFLCAVAVLISFVCISCASMEEKQPEPEKMQVNIEPIQASVAQKPTKKEQIRDESKEHLIKDSSCSMGKYEASIRKLSSSFYAPMDRLAG